MRPDEEVSLLLAGTLKLSHHIFMALTDDPAFPYAGGTTNSDTWSGEMKRGQRSLLAKMGEESMAYVWGVQARQIEALCSFRKRAVAEGWADVEELRRELVAEMERVRAEVRRKRELTIEVEE